MVHIGECPRCGKPHDLTIPIGEVTLGKTYDVVLICPTKNESFKITIRRKTGK
jgi:hypothetical protein